MLGGIGGRGKGDDRGWDGWMASPTWWTWVWVNSGSWWWTGRPGMLRFRGCKESDATERLNWTELSQNFFPTPKYSMYLSYVCTSVFLFLDLVFLFSFDGQVVMVLELKRGTGSVGLCFLSGLSPDLISDSQTLKWTVWYLCSLVPFLTNTWWVRWPPYVFSFHTVAVYLGGGREA